MDDGIITSIVESTTEVFSRMISIELDKNPAHKSESDLQQCQIMAMVGLAGRSIGILSFHCTPQTGIIITSNMLGTPVTTLDDDVKDAVGEVANMIAGNFKTRMSRRGQSFDLSVPTVVVGEKFSTRTMTDAPTVVLQFQGGGHTVFVKLNYKT